MRVTDNRNDIIEHEPVSQINNGYVTLPYTEEGFKEFISSLLGRGQEIERVIHGNFDIDITHLININNLLSQRIQQQNESTLINFSAKIYFSDESTVSLHSIEELSTYNELRAITCDSVHLSWDYLIKFHDKPHPEKQQINILIHTGRRRRKIRNDIISISDTITKEGYIKISINHTARTWAVDIESILQQYFENLIDTKTTFKKFITDNSGYMALISGLIFFIAIITITITTSDQFSTQTMAEVNKNLSDSTLTLDKRINYMSNYLAEGSWNQFSQKLVLFIIIGSVFSVILAIITGVILGSVKTGYSFITINEASKKYKETVLKEAKKDWWKLLGTILIGIATGVIGNYVFQYLTL
ncbi:hypothetical protein MKX79_14980 [Viridibacillus sp. FSL R5-0468]|uniref:hypothetical protein n=1 Tax=Viridibacillus sp. FSL R5-0468 TaxID=2921640 RepID=UPI0030FBD38E